MRTELGQRGSTSDGKSCTTPRFSVVVPAFNAEDTLGETLEAIRAQTLSEWECVVVDDGSTDSTASIIAAFCASDERFAVLTQENRGTGGAYNAGVRAATGAWVSICSADDILLSQHLEVMAEAVNRHPASDIITCNGYFLKPDASRELCYTGDFGDSERSWTLEELLERCFFSVGACYRREWHDRLGGYREDSYTEDYDFWLRAMAAGARHLYIPDALAVHRLSETQKTSSHKRVFESDIRSIESLLRSRTLTTSQVRAARLAITGRCKMIADLEPSRIRALIGRMRGAVRSGGTRS